MFERDFEIYILDIYLKMLDFYVSAGLTIQFNRFNNLFTKHDRIWDSYFFRGINLGGDFMMTKT